MFIFHTVCFKNSFEFILDAKTLIEPFSWNEEYYISEECCFRWEKGLISGAVWLERSGHEMALNGTRNPSSKKLPHSSVTNMNKLSLVL